MSVFHNFVIVSCLILCQIKFAKNSEINKNEFPSDFLFGVSTAAYQIEGGYNENGKGESIWDVHTRKYPDLVHNASNGNIACDSYHNYKEDVRLLTHLGVQFYRFSISWSRILPEGYSHKINQDGIRYYNELINLLIANGIQPVVTMYHWDLPYTLQLLGGWTNPYMANYFEDYARVLFESFGDRVKFWITLNAACVGYGDNEFAPLNNQPGIANYLCTHVHLLAHARAYHLYQEHYRGKQNGKIGLNIDATWYNPASNELEDVAAAERVNEFKLGIFANPIYHWKGDYPAIVRKRVDEISKKEGHLRSRLPQFSETEVAYIKGTYDFLGLNIYTTFLVKNIEEIETPASSSVKDMRAELFQSDAWPKSNSEGLRVEPTGARKILKWVKEKYDDPEIYIMENGFSDAGELDDQKRISYYQSYLSSVLSAIQEDKVRVKGYAAWSLMDNFEWSSGFRPKFGLYQVDFNDPKRTRTPKSSAKWYRRVIKNRKIVDRVEEENRTSGDL